MSVFEIFQKYPLVAPHRATGLKCNFFFKFAMRSLEEKKALLPPNGRQGPVAHPSGDRGLYILYPPFPLSFEPAICRHSLCHLSLKIQEKERGEKKKNGEALPNCVLFEMVEGHCYWVTYVWAKNATFGKPVIAVLSSDNL